MKITLQFNAQHSPEAAELVVIPAFSKSVKKGKKTENQLVNNLWEKPHRVSFEQTRGSDKFIGAAGSSSVFTAPCGSKILAVGLGEKTKMSFELVRKEMAKLYSAAQKKYTTIAVSLDGFLVKKKK